MTPKNLVHSGKVVGKTNPAKLVFVLFYFKPELA